MQQCTCPRLQPRTSTHYQLHGQQHLPARACRGGSSTSPLVRVAPQLRSHATSSNADGPSSSTPPQQQQQQHQQQKPADVPSQAQPWAEALQALQASQEQQQQQQAAATSRRVNMWDYKPPWCQPWSILLSGSGVVAGSWQVGHTLWITLPLALGVAAWWTLFLVVVPSSFERYVEAAERQGIDWRREMMGEE